MHLAVHYNKCHNRAYDRIVSADHQVSFCNETKYDENEAMNELMQRISLAYAISHTFYACQNFEIFLVIFLIETEKINLAAMSSGTWELKTKT